MAKNQRSKLFQRKFSPIGYGNSSRVRCKAKDIKLVVKWGFQTTRINGIECLSHLFNISVGIIFFVSKSKHVEYAFLCLRSSFVIFGCPKQKSAVAYQTLVSRIGAKHKVQCRCISELGLLAYWCISTFFLSIGIISRINLKCNKFCSRLASRNHSGRCGFNQRTSFSRHQTNTITFVFLIIVEQIQKFRFFSHNSWIAFNQERKNRKLLVQVLDNFLPQRIFGHLRADRRHILFIEIINRFQIHIIGSSKINGLNLILKNV